MPQYVMEGKYEVIPVTEVAGNVTEIQLKDTSTGEFVALHPRVPSGMAETFTISEPGSLEAIVTILEIAENRWEA